MKTTPSTRIITAVGAVALSMIGLSACSGGASGSESGGSESMGESSSASSAPMESPSASGGGADADLVGSGCAAYAKQVPSGSGSVDGMAEDPVAVAASHNPMLTTLTKAVSGKLNKDVDLVDTLSGGDFTVIAPTDDAFKKIPKKDVEALAKDKDALTKVLTYHVIPGKLSPEQIAGEHKTVEGDKVKVSGSGEKLMFNKSKLVCGGVKTANATVYMVDTVMMPGKM